jgi:hypothetical protein
VNGLVVSLLCGGVATFLVLAVIWTLGPSPRNVPRWDVFIFVGTPVYALVAGLAITSLVLAAWGISEGEDLYANLSSELGSGVLSLRVSAFLIGIKSLALVWHFVAFEQLEHSRDDFVRRRMALMHNLVKRHRPVQFPELRKLPTVVTDDNVNAFVASQYGLYLGVVILLLRLTSAGDGGNWLKVLSWAVFFVVDDWAIISTDMHQLGGRLFRSHFLRIEVFNVVIMVPLFVLVWQNFSWLGVLVSGVMIAYLAFWHFDMLSRREDDIRRQAELAMRELREDRARHAGTLG